MFKKFDAENSFENLNYNNSALVYNFLLFFNIWSTMHNKKLNGRFPFRLFKMNDWDIEHIKARRLKTMNKNSDTDRENVKKQFEALNIENKSISISIEGSDPEKLIEEWNKLVDTFSADNDIGNLTLLSSEINRSYGNGFFDEKRKEIIKRDQINAYIPLCTRNIFLKYYTTQNGTDDLSFKMWTDEDKLGYTEALKDCFNEIINKRI